jgi:hypothetical protein
MCGIGQWFPLSPYLFLLVVEGMSRSILEARISRRLQGVPFGGGVNVTHLLFLDDVLLFANGSIEEGRSMSNILKLYCKFVGMELNEENSSCYYSSIEEGVE